jgi:hypothetical protein
MKLLPKFVFVVQHLFDFTSILVRSWLPVGWLASRGKRLCGKETRSVSEEGASVGLGFFRVRSPLTLRGSFFAAACADDR